MSLLLKEIKENNLKATTTNGAIGYRETGDAFLDFFARASSFREYESNPIKFYEQSKQEMPLETLKFVFYLRDIEEGLGERKSFRRLIKHIALTDPTLLRKNLDNVIKFGRWDDLWVLLDTPLKDDVLFMIKKQLEEDLIAKHPSLLAKWLPSYNAFETKVDLSKCGFKKRDRIRWGRCITSGLNMQPAKYSKILKQLRRRIDVVECQISERRWDVIDFEKMPSKALLRYRHLFLKHCAETYKAFLEKAKSGKAKIHAKTLMPHEIISAIRQEKDKTSYDLLNTQWVNLKDYLKGSTENILVVADTSGSMTFFDKERPLNVSLALAIYCAQRNHGIFHNHFITFSCRPELIELKHDRLEDMLKHDVKYIDSNTDLKATFDLILEVAKENNLKQEDLPTKIVIVSDMQFDETDYAVNNKKALMRIIEESFNQAGYNMPKMIYWNVNTDDRSTLPITKFTKNAVLVSGYSASLFEAVLSDEIDPLQTALDLINKSRYNSITL